MQEIIELKNELKKKSIEIKKDKMEMKKDNMEMKKQLMEMKKIMATQGMLSGRSKTNANPNTNRKQRTKRLSKVMMARRNSTVKMVDPTEDENKNEKEDDMDNDWEQMTDETTGQVYYVNNNTGDSQWEMPDDLALAQQSEDELQNPDKRERLLFRKLGL